MCNETSYGCMAAAFEQGVAVKRKLVCAVPLSAKPRWKKCRKVRALLFMPIPSHAGRVGLMAVSDFALAAGIRSPLRGARMSPRLYGTFCRLPSAVARKLTLPSAPIMPPPRPHGGVQRLLTDLRYDIGDIDGFGGERTREAHPLSNCAIALRAIRRVLLRQLPQYGQPSVVSAGISMQKTSHLVCSDRQSARFRL